MVSLRLLKPDIPSHRSGIRLGKSAIAISLFSQTKHVFNRHEYHQETLRTLIYLLYPNIRAYRPECDAFSVFCLRTDTNKWISVMFGDLEERYVQQ